MVNIDLFFTRIDILNRKSGDVRNYWFMEDSLNKTSDIIFNHLPNPDFLDHQVIRKSEFPNLDIAQLLDFGIDEMPIDMFNKLIE